MKLRCLIVDDEPLAREGLRILLARHQCIEHIAEAANVSTALAAIKAQQPHVVFLDIKMPEQDGFELLAQLPDTLSPCIVMVTAFASYAVRGFEQAAVDYLLKPVEPARLKQSLERVNQRLLERQAANRLQWSDRTDASRSLADTERRGNHGGHKLCLRDASRKVLVAASDIVLIEAAGDYMCVSTSAETSVVRITLARLLQQLSSNQLLRIHRSVVVNRDHVLSIRSLGNCAYQLTLSNGAIVRSSKRYRATVAAITTQSIKSVGAD